MTSSSTSVENPVNQIASLLSGADNAPQKKQETEESVETAQDENLEVSDESQPQEESLAPEAEEAEETQLEESDDIETINNLAEELDVPIEDMYALNLNLATSKNLPEGGAITLGELKSFYESNVDITELREGLTKREQDLQTRSDELSEAPQVSNELMQARAQVLAIQDQYNRTDWQGLRHTNPAEYSALQSDFRTQFEMAKNSETLASQAVETHLVESRRQQQDRLFEAMPELKDEKVRAQVDAQVQAYAGKFGFTANDLAKVEDSRLMRLLITASKSEVAKSTAKEKQETKIPTSNRPAARKALPGRKAALKRLTEKARATGQVKDQTNAVHELLKGF